MEEKMSRRLDAVGRALRRAAESLREDNEEQMSQAVFKFSNKADQYLSSIKNKSAGDIYSKIEQFARSRPVVAFSAMAVIGAIASMFLGRSTSSSSTIEWPAGLREEERRVG
ncbi:MAG TPA: hypothetical protein DCS07_09550 [Bdellovibrionales bacterium]|nr:MAG: hypothetical protein A2X97_02875 [Bdellovibrionales bacterium GWA1_52_35]OFZ39970.1 MAG: hypothetical protein A2070_07970 [Bdellovibrionales bacterium GWC1_52_8]HAR42856.1 hypothetical protein [Bdellovibrionales bacterium]HCM40136.1 hypothetical protein [Bdellovibrionales bacterium]